MTKKSFIKSVIIYHKSCIFRIMIMWQAILLSLLLSYGSCDIFEDAIQIAFYKTVEAAKANLTNKGIFRNCGMTVQWPVNRPQIDDIFSYIPWNIKFDILSKFACNVNSYFL